jgi:hypothetical protein
MNIDYRKRFGLQSSYRKLADINYAVKLGVWIRLTMWASTTDGVPTRFYREHQGDVTEINSATFRTHMAEWLEASHWKYYQKDI